MYLKRRVQFHKYLHISKRFVKKTAAQVANPGRGRLSLSGTFGVTAGEKTEHTATKVTESPNLTQAKQFCKETV